MYSLCIRQQGDTSIKQGILKQKLFAHYNCYHTHNRIVKSKSYVGKELKFYRFAFCWRFGLRSSFFLRMPARKAEACRVRQMDRIIFFSRSVDIVRFLCQSGVIDKQSADILNLRANKPNNDISLRQGIGSKEWRLSC